MEMFELILLLLAAVLVSTVLDQVTPRVSLPLVQIGLGVAIAVIAGAPSQVEIDPELFLVLFIAPLLFDESRHASKRALWENKGAIVSLGENVEGFAPMRQLVKEDGTTATVGEKLPFKVIEFSKATKRITLSHTRLFEEAKRAERAEQAAERKASAEATKSSVKKINASVEKTTLGDIAGLAELKDAMEAAAKEEK